MASRKVKPLNRAVKPRKPATQKASKPTRKARKKHAAVAESTAERDFSQLEAELHAAQETMEREREAQQEQIHELEIAVEALGDVVIEGFAPDASNVRVIREIPSVVERIAREVKRGDPL